MRFFAIIVLLLVLADSGHAQNQDDFRINSQLDGQGFVAVIVPNADKAAQWYSQILGLETVNSLDAEDSRYHIRILRNDNLFVELLQLKDAEVKPPNRIEGFFKFGVFVKDITGFHNYLRSRLVDTDDSPFFDEALDARSFVFKDLYGNRLQAFQRDGEG